MISFLRKIARHLGCSAFYLSVGNADCACTSARFETVCLTEMVESIDLGFCRGKWQKGQIANDLRKRGERNSNVLGKGGQRQGNFRVLLEF